MKFLPKIFSFALLVLSAHSGFSQQILFRNYSVNNGLCSNTVWSITQDSQGYMWFGTKDGLNRFDGYNYKAYRYEPGKAAALGSNFIHKITPADKTHLWLATDKGVYIFDQEKEKFSFFKPSGDDVVYDIFRAKNGVMWIATRGHGLFKYNPNTSAVANYSLSSEIALLSNQIRKVVEDSEGNIWIASFGGGIDVLNPSTNKVEHYRPNAVAGTLTTSLVLELYKDLSGNIWIGTLGGGLAKWDKKARSFTSYTKGSGNSINDNTIRSIFQPSPDKLYLGTEKGLNILNLATGKFTSYVVKNNDPLSISDNAIYTIFQDREGGTWLGTYFGGVSYFREKGFKL